MKETRSFPRKIWLPLLIVPLLLPFILSYYWTIVFCIAFFYAQLGLSWAFVAGRSGQFSFAHAAIAAFGAYVSALFVLNTNLPIPVGMLLGGLLGAAVSAFLGILCLRLRAGPYLAIVTLAFSEIFRMFVTAEYEYTRGDLGLPAPSLFSSHMVIPYQYAQYYLGLSLVLILMIVIYKLDRSKVGLFTRATRDDINAAMAMGVNVVKYRVLAFTISGFFAALAGAWYVHFVGLVVPSLASLIIMGTIIATAMIGGSETVMGPVIGAISFEIVAEYLQAYGVLSKLLLAIVFLVTIKLMPSGIYVQIRRVLRL